VGIFPDYPLKTRPSKQPSGEIPGYHMIPSNPLKYPRSKQGLMMLETLPEVGTLKKAKPCHRQTHNTTRGVTHVLRGCQGVANGYVEPDGAAGVFPATLLGAYFL
jgi:hypothetical protein